MSKIPKFSLGENLDDEPEDEDEEIDLDTVKRAVASKMQTTAISNLILQNAEEDEEEDEEISAAEIAALVGANRVPVAAVERSTEGSADFIDAEQSIATDPWDLKAWSIFISETEKDRGGPVTIAGGYERYLHQFPRAASVWERYAAHYSSRGDFSSAEEVFDKCLIRCRSVSLWEAYLVTVKLRTVDRVSKYADAFEHEKRQYTDAFKKAIDSVGLSVHADRIWRKYVDFVSSWREDDPAETRNKNFTLIEIYRRAVVVPMENLDSFWTEYEQLERKNSGQLAEQFLAEYLEKYRLAKAIFEKRRNFVRKIDFDRLAIPACNDLDELHQVDAWDGWTRYELSNPHGLSPDLHKSYMEMHFSLALAPLRYHSEIWLTYADFIFSNAGIYAAKDVLREAIAVVPDVVVLRLALSEVEEKGSVEVARDILKRAFDDLPSMLSFSLWQRFCRKIDGVVGGRTAFSATISLRQNTSNPDMYCIYMAHALLELDINNEPDIALRVLDQARKHYPHADKDFNFVRLWFNVLVKQGNISQLRWLIAYILDTGKNVVDSLQMIAKDSDMDTVAANEPSTLSTEQKIDLFKEYLEIEIRQGLISGSMYNDLIARRLELKEKLNKELALRPKQLLSFKLPAHVDAVPSSLTVNGGLFDTATKLYERFGSIVPRSKIPKKDDWLMQRCSLSELITEVSKTVTLEGTGKRTVRDNSEIESLAVQLAIPSNIKELLYKLPQVSGLAVSTETFVERLRKVILPPRPMDVDSHVQLESISGYDREVEDVVEDIFRARQRQKLFH